MTIQMEFGETLPMFASCDDLFSTDALYHLQNSMKEIKAIIQPFMANSVLDALHRIKGVSVVMASEVRCTSAEQGNCYPDIHTRVDIIVTDELVETVLDAIQMYAHTGRVGDAHIYVTNVEQTLLIRKGKQTH